MENSENYNLLFNYYLQKEIDNRNEAIKWSIEDILGQAEKLGIEVSEDRAEKLLHTIISRHDSNEGVTWETIDCYLIDLKS